MWICRSSNITADVSVSKPQDATKKVWPLSHMFKIRIESRYGDIMDLDMALTMLQGIEHTKCETSIFPQHTIIRSAHTLE